MSHAVVLVNIGRMTDLVDEGIAEAGELPDRAYLEGRTFESSVLTELMEPYNEGTTVPRYRDYDSKREKFHKIESVTKDYNAGEGKVYKAVLDVRFRELPLAGRALFPDPQSISQERWMESFEIREKAEIAASDLYTDEEVARAYNEYWAQHGPGGSDEKYYVADALEDGKETRIYHWSTYNPQSKWDWYVVGGRWSGMLLDKRGGWVIYNTKAWDASYWQDDLGWGDLSAATRYTDEQKATLTLPDDGEWAPAGVDVAMKGDLDIERMFEVNNLPTYAYLDEEHGWTENGKLGWWGITIDEKMSKDDWAAQFRKLMDTVPDDAVLVAVDYHI